MQKLDCDVAVIGGGMAGICAALASARSGADTVLIQDRPVLGGNAGSEIRMHIAGASRHGARKNLRETGIIEELLLENKYRNPAHSYGLFDALLWEKVTSQEHLTLFLNTYADKVKMRGNAIEYVYAFQTTTEKRLQITPKQVIDCSGDGYLSSLCGAEYLFGRESRDTFDEPNAVEKADRVTMGNSIQFRALDAGKPVPFHRPDFAYDYSKADWVKHIKWAEITSGYWWLEIGGTDWNVISDAEKTRDEMLKILFGIWDYIKNYSNQKEEAKNLYLDWVSFLPAKRESRRMVGDYILNERDVLENRMFEDAVAYGGWHLDSHRPEGFYAFINQTPQTEDKAVMFDGIYTIPYRCLYSKNVQNLFFGGRIISASHRAFSSTRVMATCAVVGEAAGTAAAMAVTQNLSPKEVGKRITSLQQTLLKNGCYIPNVQNEDPWDLARSAKIQADSFVLGSEPEKVTNGISRPVGEESNMWQSEPIADKQRISLSWDAPVSVREVIVTFDSDLTAEIMPSLSRWHHVRQSDFIPETIVKEYRLLFTLGGKKVTERAIKENHQRRNVIEVLAECDSIVLEVTATNGCESARICEIRVYGENKDE